MMDFTNATCEPVERIRDKETAKMILENMDAILNELDNQTKAVETAIFSPMPNATEPNREPLDECILGTLNRHRNRAEEILKRVIHIREGLW